MSVNTPKSKQVICTDFTQFPELPTELRLEIIDRALLQARLIEVRYKLPQEADRHIYSEGPGFGFNDRGHGALMVAPESRRMPAIMETNKEAYEQGKRKLILVCLDNSSPLLIDRPRAGNSIYFNPHSDILYLSEDTCKLGIHNLLCFLADQGTNTEIKHVAISTKTCDYLTCCWTHYPSLNRPEDLLDLYRSCVLMLHGLPDKELVGATVPGLPNLESVRYINEITKIVKKPPEDTNTNVVNRPREVVAPRPQCHHLRPLKVRQDFRMQYNPDGSISDSLARSDEKLDFHDARHAITRDIARARKGDPKFVPEPRWNTGSMPEIRFETLVREKPNINVQYRSIYVLPEKLATFQQARNDIQRRFGCSITHISTCPNTGIREYQVVHPSRRRGDQALAEIRRILA